MIERDSVCKYIIRYVKSDKKLYDNYYGEHHKRKYIFDDIIPIIIYVMKKNIPWRAIEDLKLKINVSYQNVYKIFKKLVDDKIIFNCYNDIIDKYMKEVYNDGIIYTDTTPISNKYGNENIGRNKIYKNKNITKLSLVTDNNNIILSVKAFSGNKYDSKIAIEHIKSLTKKDAIIKNVKKIKTLVADPGYDSDKLRKIINNNNIKCIIKKNKRNTKDKEKLEKLKLVKGDKILYKKRIRIENTNAILKKHRRVDIRYDRKEATYMAFTYMSCIYRVIDYV